MGFPLLRCLPRACVPQGRGGRAGPPAVTLEFKWQGLLRSPQTRLCPLHRWGTEPQIVCRSGRPERSRLRPSLAPPPPGWCGAPGVPVASVPKRDKCQPEPPAGPTRSAFGGSQEGAHRAGPSGLARWCREDLDSRRARDLLQLGPCVSLLNLSASLACLPSPQRTAQCLLEPWECDQVSSFFPWLRQVLIIHCLSFIFHSRPGFSFVLTFDHLKII